MRNAMVTGGCRQWGTVVAVCLLAVAFNAGCEQQSATGRSGAIPGAPTAGAGKSLALPAGHPPMSVNENPMQPPMCCPSTAKPKPADCASCPADAAPKAAADSCAKKPLSCPQDPQGCPADQAGKADCADCAAAQTAAATAPATGAPLAAPRQDGVTPDGKIAGLPPVRCDAVTGCPADEVPAAAAATAAAAPEKTVTQAETVTHIEAIDGTGDKPAPCCTAKGFSLAAAATAPAAEPPAPAPEKVQLQAAPAMKPAAADGCSACDGR